MTPFRPSGGTAFPAPLRGRADFTSQLKLGALSATSVAGGDVQPLLQAVDALLGRAASPVCLVAEGRWPATKAAATEPGGPADAREPALLMALNGQFEGAAGEVFNRKGKTDTLIRVEDRHVFISECPSWKSPKTITEQERSRTAAGGD